MIDDGAKALKVDYVGAETTKAYPENEVIYYSNKFYKVIKEGGLPANYTIVPATDLDDAGLDPETIVTINGIPANGIINASDITFDNTGTGMAATNVQGAVTELNSNISTKQASLLVNSYNLTTDTDGLAALYNKGITTDKVINVVASTNSGGVVTSYYTYANSLYVRLTNMNGTPLASTATTVYVISLP